MTGGCGALADLLSHELNTESKMAHRTATSLAIGQVRTPTDDNGRPQVSHVFALAKNTQESIDVWTSGKRPSDFSHQ